MKIKNATLVTVLVLMTVNYAASQASAVKPWSAATYHGLIIGTSTRAEVLKLLGRPDYVGREEDTGTPIMNYEVVDPIPGTITVYIKKGILDGIYLYPKGSLTKRDIIRLLGPGYIVVHYAADDCLDSGGAAPIYQSASGSLKYMEYRDRGLAAAFAYNDDEKIEGIIYTFKQLGPVRSACAGHGKNR